MISVTWMLTIVRVGGLARPAAFVLSELATFWHWLRLHLVSCDSKLRIVVSDSYLEAIHPPPLENVFFLHVSNSLFQNEGSSRGPITFRSFLGWAIQTEYNLVIHLLLCSILEVLWFLVKSSLHACWTFHLKLRPASWSRVSTNHAWDSWWVSNGYYKIKLIVRKL